MRDKYLKEMYISMIIGGMVAAILCNFLPRMKAGLDGMILYLVFWLMATCLTWGVIDIKDERRKKNDRREAS